jgi:hypothetical protein
LFFPAVSFGSKPLGVLNFRNALKELFEQKEKEPAASNYIESAKSAATG